jgi:hypothetical protein
MESKMNRYFWPADHPAASLALVATAILVVAWPLENMPACALAAVMMVVAAGLVELIAALVFSLRLWGVIWPVVFSSHWLGFGRHSAGPRQLVIDGSDEILTRPSDDARQRCRRPRAG